MSEDVASTPVADPEPRHAVAERTFRRRRLAVVALTLTLGAVGALAWSERSGPSKEASTPRTPSATSSTLPRATTTGRVTTTRRTPPPPGTTPDPMSLLVLVDRQRALPDGWEPTGLVDPAVPFNFGGFDPKRLLRPQAAKALEALFFTATASGHPLVGVSAYRSAATQVDVFSSVAGSKGEAEAERSTARPGHSEHQTGLAVDVTGADRRCPAEACFAGTPAAAWLAVHAWEFGFVIRYPGGAEPITGYEYEPWHLRYVGKGPAAEMHSRGITLEEYLGIQPD